MSGVRRQAELEPGGQDLLAWRIARLCSAGFSHPDAQRLAGDRRYDLHALLDLVDRGCPPELAARILAPLKGHERSRC